MMGLALFVVIAALASQGIGHYHDAFEQFKIQHQKTYRTVEEQDARRAVFERNLKLIEKHNEEEKLGLHSYTMGINQFTDLTEEEFTSRYAGLRQNAINPIKVEKSIGSLSKRKGQTEAPESVNWVEQGFVTPVRNQECGDCWSFAAAANIESNWAIKTKTNVNDTKYWVSTQQLDDCVYDYPGCKGGGSGQALQYVHDNGGVMLEKDLPYKGEATNGSCGYDSSKAAIGVSAVHHLENEEELGEAIVSSPATVAICSGPVQSYTGGVVENCDDCQVDHAVLVVGYGQEKGKDYWLIKNSWAKSWGEQGYLKLLRNKNCVHGPSFPDVFNILP